MAVTYLVGRLQNQPDIKVIEYPSPTPIVLTATPTTAPIDVQNVDNRITPTPTKARVKIPVLISSVAYYCFEDMANTVSSKQIEVTKLKKELGVCEFNYSQAQYNCGVECQHNIEVCKSNCYTTMPDSDVSSYLSTCQSDCSSNAPACSCPNAVSCQNVSGTLSKSQSDLNDMIKKYCP